MNWYCSVRSPVFFPPSDCRTFMGISRADFVTYLRVFFVVLNIKSHHNITSISQEGKIQPLIPFLNSISGAGVHIDLAHCVRLIVTHSRSLWCILFVADFADEANSNQFTFEQACIYMEMKHFSIQFFSGTYIGSEMLHSIYVCLSRPMKRFQISIFKNKLDRKCFIPSHYL